MYTIMSTCTRLIDLCSTIATRFTADTCSMLHVLAETTSSVQSSERMIDVTVLGNIEDVFDDGSASSIAHA